MLSPWPLKDYFLILYSMKSKDRRIRQTEDGSYTFFVPALNEHYHSTKGAYTESRHIYIDNGFNACNAERLNVLEVGFGTGLNGFLTAMEAGKREVKTTYTTLERYPIPWDEVASLHLSSNGLFREIHACPWDIPCELTPFFTLLKKQSNYLEEIFRLPPERYDLVYFDAFAPEKQPEMWQEELFRRLYVIMKPNGRLTTYCVKGEIRRILQRCGFTVKRLPGPPQGKKQILNAIKD